MPVDMSEKEIKVEDFVEYPDPDSQEEEEVEDEIDTGKIQEAMEKTKEENPLSLIMPLIPRNPTDDGMEDFQKMLMGIFSQFMGARCAGRTTEPRYGVVYARVPGRLRQRSCGEQSVRPNDRPIRKRHHQPASPLPLHSVEWSELGHRKYGLIPLLTQCASFSPGTPDRRPSMAFS